MAEPEKSRTLPLEFFNRPAARVARDLVGMIVVRSLASTTLSLTITETEAYEGEHDRACHSAKGRTGRTEVMFGPAGRFYIYRIYGLHWMLNIVTGEVNDAAAVLVRGVDGVSGPGRVAAALNVDSPLRRPARVLPGVDRGGDAHARPFIRLSQAWPRQLSASLA